MLDFHELLKVTTLLTVISISSPVGDSWRGVTKSIAQNLR
jgi:hypothetical protein